VPERLREVAQGQAVLAEQLLGDRGERAGPQRRGERLGVDGDEPGQAAQIERHHRGEPGPARGEPADDRGAAAVGHDRDAVLGAHPQHGQHLVVVGGQHDGVRCVGRVPGAQPDQVGRGAAAGVADPGLVVLAQVVGADGVDERGARRRRQVGGRDPDVGQRDGLMHPRWHAERLLQQRDDSGGERVRPGRVAPAVPEHVAGLRRRHVRLISFRSMFACQVVTL
jgi:hypothetical protein